MRLLTKLTHLISKFETVAPSARFHTYIAPIIVSCSEPYYYYKQTRQLASSTGNFLTGKTKSKMSTVSVKNHEGDERLHIYLQLTAPSSSDASSTNPMSIKFNLSRLKNEELRLAIERLRLNLNKKQSKKSKKKKSKPVPTDSDALKNKDESSIENDGVGKDPQDEILPIEIIHNGGILDLSVLNENAWVEGALLKVGDEKIPITYNPPGVTLEKLPNSILEGCPIFPGAETEFTSVDYCEFYWKTFDGKSKDKIKMQISHEKIDLHGAVQSHSFTPQAEDVGRFLLLVCIPKRGNACGKMEAVISQAAITQGPGHCPFEKRHEHTKETAEHGQFRTMTYNLLADIYTDTDFAREQLFHYCPPEALAMDYRKHLLLKEIVGYNADLLCLQEVDKHIFSSHLLPALSSLGFTGLFKQKAGQCSEGCASFIRNDKFRVVTSHDIVLSDYLASDPACADIWAEVSKVESLKETIQERTSVLQVTVVESVENPGQYVCLANTHLYFHPSACNIRLLHAATALRHIQSISDAYAYEGKPAAMIFCGDFNSAPHLGVFQLMTSQMVPKEHADWKSASEKGQVVTTLDLFQPKNIVSACGAPPYTNYTSGFIATLDYIFIDNDLLKVTKVIPLPSDDEVKANVAIPSRVFPSDHLALVCELTFR